MLSLSNFAAEMEREKASQRTYDAMFRKAKALHVTGNKVFGYDNVPVYSSEANMDGTQRRQYVVRKISSEQSKVVVRIFELYASGFGLARIAKTLNEDRIPPPHGGNLGWCPTALRDILHRDLYRGVVLWNRTQAIQRGGTRKQRKRPESEWLRIEAPELRIISQVVWEQVEERRTRNQRAYLRGEGGRILSRPSGEHSHSKYLLSSLAKCITCGGSIVAIKRTAKRGNPRTVYAAPFITNEAVASVRTMSKSVKISSTRQYCTPSARLSMKEFSKPQYPQLFNESGVTKRSFPINAW